MKRIDPSGHQDNIKSKVCSVHPQSYDLDAMCVSKDGKLEVEERKFIGWSQEHASV